MRSIELHLNDDVAVLDRDRVGLERFLAPNGVEELNARWEVRPLADLSGPDVELCTVKRAANPPASAHLPLSSRGSGARFEGMRLAIGAFLLQLVCAPASLAMANRGVTLDSLQWKHRVLLLPATQKALSCADWIANSNALRERHLVLFREDDGEYRQWFPKPQSPTTLELSTKMRARVAGRVTLIGKDGGVKRQWQAESCELPAAVFPLIDSMPMRQREMRQKKEAPGRRAATTC